MQPSALYIPETLAPLTAAFGRVGGAVYAVGGFVRNSLLRLPASDLDVCSALSPDALKAALADTDIRIVDKAPAFGTVELHFGGIVAEHTTLRADCYTPDGTHRPDAVRFTDSLQEDALRRDFTVNALYADLATGRLIDPTGGLADLERGLLRAAATPAERTLQQDALRILRLVRFACQLGFTIDGDTWEAARRNAGKLSAIAPERIQKELNQILLCEQKYPSLPADARRSVLSGLSLLDELDVWADVIAPIAAMRGMAQRSDHHRYDVLHHTFHVCAETPPDLTMRLAGLLHDVGKPACRQETGNLHLHDLFGERIAQDVLTHLRYPLDTVKRVSELVLYHMYDIQNTARDETLRTRFALWGRELTRQLICLREADIRGCGYDTEYVNTRWRTLYETMQREHAPFSENELAVSGSDIMSALGIPAGRQVGELKRKLFLHCARHPSDNNRPTLLRLIRDCARVR